MANKLKKKLLHRLVKKVQKPARKKAREQRREQENRTSGVESQEIDESLAAIYTDEDGGMPDLSVIQPGRSRWWYVAVTAIVVFAVGSVLAAGVLFSVLKPFRGFSGDALKIQIEGPEQVAVGKETTYFINYQNIASEPLAQSELRVTFPGDFVIRERVPEPNDGGGVWRLGALYPGDRGTITVRGTFTGALGTESAVQIVGIYRPASFNSDFETLATKILRYTESVLEGELAVPSKVLPGDEIDLTYTVRNSGDESVEDMVVRLTLPEGFEEEGSATGTITGRVFEIPIGSIGPGTSSTVIVHGRFAASVSGDVTLLAETGRISDAGVFLPSERSDAKFTVLTGDLLVRLVANGQDQELKIPYGGFFRFGARFENTSSEDLHDVELRLILEPLDESCRGACTVDWKTYQDSASGTPRGDRVVWGDEKIPGLKRLLPREDGGVDISVDALSADNGRSGLAFRAYLEADIGAIGGTPIDRTVKSSPIIIRYVTDASLASVARYFLEEGAPVGVGPLPPIVGEETTYRIEWMVTKSFHELGEILVRAPLSKIASWAGNTIIEAGELGFDATNGVVTWRLNRMPEDVDEIRVGFDVTVKPGEADADRFAKILGETTFEAKDLTTDHVIIQTQPELTTDLRDDEYAEGKGLVRRTE